jgi:hypothetical protein
MDESETVTARGAFTAEGEKFSVFLQLEIPMKKIKNIETIRKIFFCRKLWAVLIKYDEGCIRFNFKN